MKKFLFLIGGVAIVAAVFGIVYSGTKKDTSLVTNFSDCVLAGNPVMESYPRQCRHDGQLFTEDIGNELEKADLIRIDSPRPNEGVASPLKITGEARGFWFFEASFPVSLLDAEGEVVASGIATAQEEWMTEDFVPFEAVLTFTRKETETGIGKLILHKDNPSGLVENDDQLIVPVIILGGAAE